MNRRRAAHGARLRGAHSCGGDAAACRAMRMKARFFRRYSFAAAASARAWE
jgi:hypothetical protein